MSGIQSVFVGDSFTNKIGLKATVIEYNGNKNVKIMFDTTGYVAKTTTSLLNRRSFRDLLNKNLYGVSYASAGKYKAGSLAHIKWGSMLDRVYYNVKLGYENTSVCDDWLDFQNYARWHELNYVKGYQLDKDLKIYGNLEYSPDACMFVPQAINNFFVFKRNKNREFPFGVSNYNKGYTGGIKPFKTVYNIKDAVSDYWNKKYINMEKLITIYPEYETLLENYFEEFFNEHYPENIDAT